MSSYIDSCVFLFFLKAKKLSKKIQLSSANLIRTCEVFMTWFAVWDCNLIVKLGMVILNN